MTVAKKLGAAASVCIAAALWAVARLLAYLHMGKLLWPVAFPLFAACLVAVWLVALKRDEADRPRPTGAIIALALVCIGAMVVAIVAVLVLQSLLDFDSSWSVP